MLVLGKTADIAVSRYALFLSGNSEGQLPESHVRSLYSHEEVHSGSEEGDTGDRLGKGRTGYIRIVNILGMNWGKKTIVFVMKGCITCFENMIMTLKAARRQ